MKFLCLAYYDVEKFYAKPPDELRAITSQCPPHDAALRESGSLLSLASLGEVRASVTVRVRGGKPTVTERYPISSRRRGSGCSGRRSSRAATSTRCLRPTSPTSATRPGGTTCSSAAT